MMHRSPHLSIVFFRTASGREPVRAWLMKRSKADRIAIAEQIKVVQYGWPIGMPVVRKLQHVICRSHAIEDMKY